MSHFHEMTALLYLEGQLDDGQTREISAHAASCAECGELLHALQNESAWLRESLQAEDEPVPARLTVAPERGAAPWGWIAAIALSVGGAYTLWSGLIQPWRVQAAQAGFTQGNLLTMILFSSAFWKGWDAMPSLMEFSALGTLGLVVMWLLRRQWRRLPTVTVVMGAVLCALALPVSTAAAEIKHGDPSYTLPAGQVINTDLIVFADHTRIDGDVNGDLIVWSRRVTVDGHIKGDIIAFAGELRVNGPVDGNVRCLAQTVTLNGIVGKNAMVGGGEVDLDEKAKVGGTMMLGIRSAELNGQLGGDLLAFGSDVDVNGSLGHDATVRSEKLSIGSNAEIKGQTKYQGPSQPEVSSGAKLATPIAVTINERRHGRDYASPHFYLRQTLLWGASSLFGLVVLSLAPGFFFDAQNACNKTVQSMAFGLLFLVGTPIAAIIVCITFVGLAVGFSTLLLYVIFVYSAQVYVGAWLGDKILGSTVGMGPALGRLALGLAVLRAARMLPYIGGWITFLVLILGLGAVALALYKNIRPQLAPAAA
jgi:cytoskeletal protein CcmA (bactofilin family)